MEIGPEIIALDATGAPRPGGMSLDEFFWQAKEKYPKQLWMADCSTVEEAFHADSLGFDFIGPTKHTSHCNFMFTEQALLQMIL